MASGGEGLGRLSQDVEFRFQTRLRAGCSSEYERVHKSIPPELELDIRSAGCTAWSIHRNGLILSHFLRTRDPECLFQALDTSPAHAAWQKIVSPLLDGAEPILAVEPGDPGSLVWSLDFSER